jgi:putative SOS response-associated peptidase YedK
MRMLADDSMPVSQAPSDDEDNSPRQSYNFAPGYHGIVYRATTGDEGSAGHSYAGTKDTEEVQALGGDAAEQKTPLYMLQSMKWGLIPFWTKRNPDYSTIMRTINCRDDSLATSGGMWTTMKARKRCIVIAQGFYEWLNVGPKNKLPHFIKRKDGHLMCFAGLWDCVQFEGIVAGSARSVADGLT